jgi:AcrR family transcriptional regulator
MNHNDFEEGYAMNPKKRLDMEAILSAAAELAEEKGLENIALNQLAERLGVKSPSLYNYLGGASELSGGLAKLALKRLEDAVRNAAVGKSRRDALMGIAVEYRKFAKGNPELYKAILKLPACDDSVIREAGHDLVLILYKVMEPYCCGEEDAIHFVRGFRSVLHGFVSLEEAGFFKSPCDMDESYTRLVSGYISTLKTQEDL